MYPSPITVLAAGHHLDANGVRLNPAPFQAELENARRIHGHALCECRKPPLRLVIRERSGRLHLASWPDQTDQHAPHCPFFRESRLHSGASHYPEGTIQSHPDSSEATRLNFSKDLRDSRPTIRSDSGETVRMWGLLHYLWDSSGLNRWHPGWKRDWGLARHFLMKAALETTVHGLPLSDALFIPRVFRPSIQEQANQDWGRFTKMLRLHHRSSDQVFSGFVIGLVRNLIKESNGYTILLHHLNRGIYLPQARADMSSRMSRRAWSLLTQSPESRERKHHVAVMVRVESSNTGSVVAADCVFMRVSHDFIPVHNSQEESLAEWLVANDRELHRPLSYDQPVSDLPSFVLRDVSPDRRVFLEMSVIPTGPAPFEQQRMVARKVEDAFSHGHQCWVWNTGESDRWPSIPEAVEWLPSTP